MRHLPPPTDQNAQAYVAGDVFETCVSMVKNVALKAKLLAVRPNVEAEAADYDAKAVDMQLYLKQRHDVVGAASCGQMVKVYTNRMVRKTSKGRPIYDRIMAAPMHRRCPLCGIGAVNTLDHYLPKKHFPVFSVTPNNLVPACEWCQGKKKEYFPTTMNGQLLHPYFDNVENEIWLAAEVVAGTPAVFRYFTSPPDHWLASTKVRVMTHLKELKLQELFTSNAGSRLSEIRTRLANLHRDGGEDAVRAHLREDLVSMEADHKNSWVAAMYRAAVTSDWFCNGGFSET